MNYEKIAKYLTNKEYYTVLDIGAHHGEFYYELKKHVPNSRVYSIEALPENMEKLLSINPLSLQAVLSDKRQLVNFYLPNDEMIPTTGASYYCEKTDFYTNPRILQLETITLNELSQIYEIPLVYDLIKIDTQGSEIDILKGATNIRTKYLLLEMPLMEYNKNAPNFNQYLDYLNKNNFYPVEIVEEHKYIHGEIIQIDMLFKKIYS
jgi:FkbM family methyltransferase